jgi:hypothetical protein
MAHPRIFYPNAIGKKRILFGGRGRGKVSGGTLLQSGLGGMGQSATTSAQGFGLQKKLKNLKLKRGNIKISF